MPSKTVSLCVCCDTEFDGRYTDEECEIKNFGNVYQHTTKHFQIWKENVQFVDGFYSNEMRWVIGSPNSNIINSDNFFFYSILHFFSKIADILTQKTLRYLK